MTLEQQISDQLIALGNSAVAEHSSRFFKTAPGEYGAGDQFLGIRVPLVRKTLKQHRATLSLKVAAALLQSQWHEIRLFSVLALVELFKTSATPQEQKAIIDHYLTHRQQVNNWDLVDSSAPGLTGAWFYARDRQPLDQLLLSDALWDRRIAMLSTFYYIRQNDLSDTFKYAQQLLKDPQDLMHKAAGWMLREAGKRDSQALCRFLEQYRQQMPRTMLRYAIERLPAQLRKAYMAR